MIRSVLAGLMLLLNVCPVLAESTWKADKSHTAIQFKVQHMIFSQVTGRFNDYDVTAVTPTPDEFENGSVEVTIQTKSIDTNNEQRDNHLRSNDFLNAEQFPVITFKSKSLKKTGDKKYTLTGDLTIRDVTKPVELELELYGIGQTMQGKRTIAGFHVSGTIDRFDFNVKFDRLMETGGFVVGKEIKFDMDIELLLQN